LQGSGIEPFFAIVYIRYNAAGIDALKEGKTPAEKDTFFEVNPLFEEIAKKHNYFGLKKEELYKKINDNHKSLKGLKEIPLEVQELFQTSHELTPLDHVRMQCAFQKHTDNAVSKTVNLVNEATEEDVEEVYDLAYELGAKGVTIYRDGSKKFQILNINENKKDSKRERKPEEELSDYYLVNTGYGALHIHINYDKIGPTKIFANISPMGTEISGLTTALTIVLSKYFGLGGDPIKILKHLNSIKSEKPYGFGRNKIDSISHGISTALRKHLVKTGKLKEYGEEIIIEDKGKERQQTLEEVEISVYCPKCFSSNVSFVSGCSEPTCFDCGYSKCS